MTRSRTSTALLGDNSSRSILAVGKIGKIFDLPCLSSGPVHLRFSLGWLHPLGRHNSWHGQLNVAMSSSLVVCC